MAKRLHLLVHVWLPFVRWGENAERLKNARLVAAHRAERSVVKRCSIPARVRRKKIQLPDLRNPGSNPRRERVRFLTSLARRLGFERPGFDSGFGPTAMSEMARAVGLAQQRRNERCHGTTPTDVTDAEERPQLRHCAWSRKCPSKP